MTIIQGFSAGERENDILVVLLHGYANTPNSLNSLRQLAAQSIGACDAFSPQLPTGLFDFIAPEQIVAHIVSAIDTLNDRKAAKTGHGYSKIVLIGHSMGSLIARQVYTVACGTAPETELHHAYNASLVDAHHPRAWAKQVDRLILFAGMNRGWQISHQLSVSNALLWSFGTAIAALPRLLGWQPVIFSIKRGAPFLTRVRIEWMQMRRNAKAKGCGDALTIQLLGSIDDMVSPEDNIDLVSGQDFVYLDMPFSNHTNVIDMTDRTLRHDYTAGGTAQPRAIGEMRSDVASKALSASKERLEEMALYPSDVPPPGADAGVTDVVFVIHGIRDNGYWTQKIARAILKLAKSKGGGIRVATETSSYGYFPMLQFISPSRRRARVEWLMDQYAQALSRYPNAQFSFVGHSNGTYLLARALEEYPFCRFKNVVFAGSVVHRNYDWEKAKKLNRVGNVINYVATADWVVAFFPKAIGMLRLQDLGSAGHDGFERLGDKWNIRFVTGGHGAALEETNWSGIAEFILTGDPQAVPGELTAKRRSWVVTLGGFVAPAILATIGAALWWLWYQIGGLSNDPSVSTLFLVAYAWVLWKIGTRL